LPPGNDRPGDWIELASSGARPQAAERHFIRSFSPYLEIFCPAGEVRRPLAGSGTGCMQIHWNISAPFEVSFMSTVLLGRQAGEPAASRHVEAGTTEDKSDVLDGSRTIDSTRT